MTLSAGGRDDGGGGGGGGGGCECGCGCAPAPPFACLLPIARYQIARKVGGG